MSTRGAAAPSPSPGSGYPMQPADRPRAASRARLRSVHTSIYRQKSSSAQSCSCVGVAASLVVLRC